MSFAALNLAKPLLEAIALVGYTVPTPIQMQAIPIVLAQKDLLAGAQTGTGKTAAFALPILQNLSRMSEGAGPASGKGGKRGIRVLVMTPTRELAAQVEESFRTYGKFMPFTSTVIFGGVGQAPQVEQLRKGVDILVATPGRLLDLSEQKLLTLSEVKILVLDEADRMLDMGFIHDVKKVLKLLPADKQSVLFSATFSDEIRDLAGNLLHSPVSVQVTPPNTTVELINQVVHPVARDKKKELLEHVIKTQNLRQVLVFTRTKHGANSVSEYLTKHGISSMALHGNKSQTARTQALAGFKSGDLRALVATDIAARGLDIDELPNVVNYEIPNVSEDYVHRIGRTGRAGAKGEAISFVSLDEEGFMDNIESFIRLKIPVVRIAEYAPQPTETAQPIAMGRQCIWGGRGRMPSKAVMDAAAKAMRREIAQNMQERKALQQGGAGKGKDKGGKGKGKAKSEDSESEDGDEGAYRGGSAAASSRPAAKRDYQSQQGKREAQPQMQHRPQGAAAARHDGPALSLEASSPVQKLHKPDHQGGGFDHSQRGGGAGRGSGSQRGRGSGFPQAPQVQMSAADERPSTGGFGRGRGGSSNSAGSGRGNGGRGGGRGGGQIVSESTSFTPSFDGAGRGGRGRGGGYGRGRGGSGRGGN